jgi:6-phosphogluconolactonase
MSTRIEIFETQQELSHAAALRIADAVIRAVDARGWCHLALPGGPFVRPIFLELSQFQLPWSEVMFFFTDQRCVPVSHPASNFGEAIDKFLKNPRIGLHQFQRIEAELPDRERAAEDYAQVLPEVFDFVLAELGADGHIAALYPHSSAMSVAEDCRVLPVLAPTRPAQRITLAPAVLTGARESLLVACGPDRAAWVARALASAGAIAANPARLLLRGTWMLDKAAAAELAT